MKNRLFTFLFAAVVLTAAAESAAAQVAVVGSMTHVTENLPGDRFSGVITLRNEGTSPQTVRIFQTDYQFHADGTVYYDEPGSNDRSNAQWIKLPLNAVTVGAGETVPVSYSVSVPGLDDLTGTYWSIIMIESQLGGSAESTGTLGMQHLMRFGVQIITEFTGGYGELATTSASLARRDGVIVFTVSVENTGTRMLRPGVSLELYAHDGSQAGPFEAVPKRLYPGSSASFEVSLDGIAAGDYRAVAVLDAGANDLFAAQFSLQIR